MRRYRISRGTIWMVVIAALALLLASCGQQPALEVGGGESVAVAVHEPVDVTASGSSATHNGAVFEHVPAGDVSGTGVFDPFLRLQAPGNRTFQNGFNTDVNRPSYFGGTPVYDARDPKTISRLLSTIPSVDHEVEPGDVRRFREIFLDLNEAGNSPLLSLDDCASTWSTAT
jgi:hypothetical protein